MRAAVTINDTFSTLAEKLICAGKKELTSQIWSDAEFTLVALFVLAGLREKNDRWLQLDKKSVLISKPNSTLQSSFESECGSVLGPKKLAKHLYENCSLEVFNLFFRRPLETLQAANPDPRQKLIDLCDHWRWRQTPKAVWKSLKSWHYQDFKLKLRFDIPSPNEVLEMQIRGERCVSVFCENQQIQKVHEHNRDAFLFVAHDLEHAWEFFSRPDLFVYQKQWSCLLHQAFVLGPWKNFVVPSLQDGLNYLLSDMNSHPWHALLTLENLWLQNWKSLKRLAPRERLNASDEQDCKSSWQQLLNFWRLEQLTTLPSSSRINYFLAHLEAQQKTQNF